MNEICSSIDYSERPFLVCWETTHACDLVCQHCRANAEPEAMPGELSTQEAKKLIREVSDWGVPVLIFSGGDPLKRIDLEQLIEDAVQLGIRTAAIPAVTGLLKEKRLEALKKAGLHQIAFSLDAANAEEHDRFRGKEGVFQRTLESVRIAHRLGFSVQINTLINIHNILKLDELICLVQTLPIVFWEVFFLVPVGRAMELAVLDAGKMKEAFEAIYALSRRASFIIKVTEAQHYRRFVFEKEWLLQGRKIEEIRAKDITLPSYLKNPTGPGKSIGRAPVGVNAGKGFVFVSAQGDVFPSGFLPVAAGNIRKTSLRESYQNAVIMRELRDASLLKGRCGQCLYREICGGSRSRAFALTGDYLAEEESCDYQPVLPIMR
ncbi:MAG: TIGR04053 family radical SAM/SPASM domain-containing protein [Candidatus Omnitrophica bacterium]|nr:TIGR04053 family radical SAM/SPASM domain-containing protein [Candidatus Omnitrophota bacterium]